MGRNLPVCQRNWVVHNSHASDEEKLAFVAPPIMCRDGYAFSAQAGPYHYSDPRRYLADGNYDSWEIMLTELDDKTKAIIETALGGIIRYTPAIDEPIGRVPTSVVEEIINAHGGWEHDPAPYKPPSIHRSMKRIIQL